MREFPSGRMLMEANELPVIIPVWLTGESYAFLPLHNI
jgi:hypothetical protein